MFNKILTVKAPATNTGSISKDRRFSLLSIESATGCDVSKKLKLLICIWYRTNQKLVVFWQTRQKDVRFKIRSVEKMQWRKSVGGKYAE
jgi:hypothetical protein